MPINALQKQLIHFPMSQGIDTKTDPKQSKALLDLQNGQFTNPGQINKRFGNSVFSQRIQGGGTITHAENIATYKNELVLFDGYNLFSFIESNNDWANRGYAFCVTSENKRIIRTQTAQQLNPDVAYQSGIEVTVYEDSRGGSRYCVQDTATKAWCAFDQSLSTTGIKPKCISYQNLIYTFYIDPATWRLNYRIVNPFNPGSISNSTPILFDGYTNFSYDICTIGNLLCFGYLSNTIPTGEIKILTVDPFNNQNIAIVETNPSSVINPGSNSVINLVPDSSNNLWISWCDGLNVRSASFTSVLNQVLADTVVDTVTANYITATEIPGKPNTMAVIYDVVNNSNPENTIVKVRAISQTGMVGSSLIQRGMGIASKAFKFNNNIHFNGAIQSPQGLQNTYHTLFVSNIPAANNNLSNPINVCFPSVAKINHMVGGGLRTNNMLCEVAPYFTSSTPTTDPTYGTFLTSNLIKGSFISESNTQFTILGVNNTKLNFAAPTRFSTVTHADNMLIAGGVVLSYDGVSPFECGYHYYPEGITAVASGGDGYLSSGTYQVVAVYAWADNGGKIHYSSPSPAVTFTASANNHVVYTAPTNRLTQRTHLNSRAEISVQFYRTQAAGSTFYLVTDVIAPLTNDITVDSVSFTDFASDQDILADATIYTNGGVLPNMSPPSCGFMTLYQNRVVIGGLPDGELWFSKNRFDNSSFNIIPTEFTATNIIGCDPRGGEITALGLLDINLIIFKQNNIFFLNGDGPDDRGGGTPFADPQMISSAVGCDHQNSIEITAAGLVFQSDKGIYLLDPSVGNPSYLGAPMENFNSFTINDSVALPNTTQIVFTTDNGPALVYDYYSKQWGQWTNHQSKGSAIFNGTFCFVKQNGQVWQQNQSVFTDNGTPISLSITTPNYSFVGLNGFQRVFKVFLLGSFKGPHTLQIEVAYDYNPIYTQRALVNAVLPSNIYGTGIYGTMNPYGGAYSIYEYRVDLKQQRCTAIRLRISDIQASNYNEGFALSDITFQVGILSGGNRLGKANIVESK